jgi:hypothetical protein
MRIKSTASCRAAIEVKVAVVVIMHARARLMYEWVSSPWQALICNLRRKPSTHQHCISKDTFSDSSSPCTCVAQLLSSSRTVQLPPPRPLRRRTSERVRHVPAPSVAPDCSQPPPPSHNKTGLSRRSTAASWLLSIIPQSWANTLSHGMHAVSPALPPLTQHQGAFG